METYFAGLGLSDVEPFNAQDNTFGLTALATRIRPLVEAWVDGGWVGHRYHSPARLLAHYQRLRAEVAALGVAPRSVALPGLAHL
eukprot:11126276-Alexandrium_andersonii.AAC.1